MLPAISEPLMPLPAFSSGRIVLIAGLLAASLAACGRRGPLEAPLTQAELAAQQQGAQTQQQGALDDDDATVQGAGITVPVPTPRRRSRALTVPQEPFILDPLL
jgi:predicted small lipoprotein YifL